METIRQLNELREQYYSSYKGLSKEERDHLYEEIRKKIFILLCIGYYTDSVEEDEVYTEVTFTMEEIEEMYTKQEDSCYPLMRSFATSNHAIMNLYPHPREISLIPRPKMKQQQTPGQLMSLLAGQGQLMSFPTGFSTGWGSFQEEEEEEDMKSKRQRALIDARYHLNSFVRIYLYRWNIGIDPKTGDIRIIEPPEREFKLIHQITELLKDSE